MYDYYCFVEGGESVFKFFSGCIFVSVFWLFFIVLVGMYSGNLIVFLIVLLDKLLFNFLDEMIV